MDASKRSFIVLISSLAHRFSNFNDDVCDYIGCQFALESNYGKSVTAANYCGMKNPLVRISTAIHAGDGVYKWASYSSLECCVVDYLLCLQYHRPLSTNYDTVLHFASFISKFYCPEPDYIDKINRIYQSLKSYKNE